MNLSRVFAWFHVQLEVTERNELADPVPILVASSVVIQVTFRGSSLSRIMELIRISWDLTPPGLNRIRIIPLWSGPNIMISTYGIHHQFLIIPLVVGPHLKQGAQGARMNSAMVKTKMGDIKFIVALA